MNIRASTAATLAPQPLPELLYNPFCLSVQQSLGFRNTGPGTYKQVVDTVLVNANSA